MSFQTKSFTIIYNSDNAFLNFLVAFSFLSSLLSFAFLFAVALYNGGVKTQNMHGKIAESCAQSKSKAISKTAVKM